MNLRKQFVVLVAAVCTSLLGFSAMAKSPFQTVEFDDFVEAVYIPCLGEHVDLFTHFTIRFREFETPSGNSHYIEHWTWNAEWTGLVSGTVWLSKGNSPGSFHVGPGEVGQWTSSELAKPIIGDGPRLRYNARFKFTVNANGELKVLSLPPDDFFAEIRCLGSAD